MKKLSVFCTALFALSVSAELLAQTHGPRYNPGGGRSSGSSSSSGPSTRSSSPPSNTGSRYNPPSRSSSSSSSSGNTGSRYNPPSRSSSSGSTGSRYSPPSSSGSVSTGRRYDPNPSSPRDYSESGYSRPVVIGPRYNPNPAPTRYEPPRHQRNPGSVIIRRDYSHVPRPVVIRTVGPRYAFPHDYYSYVNRRYIYRRWIQEPVIFSYSNGYWDIDGYPYYVHRGFRYRYDPVDICQYELVDGDSYTTVKTFPAVACTTAYDLCAVDRDRMNREIGLERYFCAEAVDKDQEQTATETYRPTPIEMTDAKKEEIKQFLDDMTFKDVYRAGKNGVGKCSIQRIGGLFKRGNKYGCKFLVKVDDKVFPETDESICSDSSVADAIGCDVGTEKKNAGCILQQAIEAGYCL